MKKVIYMGDDKALQGETALAREEGSKFLIQFDTLSLPHSHGWHEYDEKDFITIAKLMENLKSNTEKYNGSQGK